MKNINICALHPDINTVEDIKTLFYGCNLDNQFHFIWDDEHPDYIIVSEMVYYQDKYAMLFKGLMSDTTVNIFCTGENISPDLNVFDYAIVFDRNLCDGDRIFRIPSMAKYATPLLNDTFVKGLNAKELLESKSKFCNFIYSNPEAHENRDKLFYKLCEYKKVDSLGPHLNNMGNQTSRNASDWRLRSIMARLPYKFSVAAENVTFRGGITEKLISCFQARTIPIYWGDPTVSEEFNTRAFINCHNYSSFEEMLDRVKAIDKDDALWCEIISQPWQTEEQRKADFVQLEKYHDFLVNIFSQDIKEAKRVGIGYHPTLYRKWFSRERDNLFISKREEKLMEYYKVLVKWTRLHTKKVQIADILKRKQYYSVAVYGIGEIGKLLLDELIGSDVSVEYGIDQSAVEYKGISVVPITEQLDSVDVIIVTIPSAFKEIKQNLEDKVSCPIISIEDVVNEIEQ